MNIDINEKNANKKSPDPKYIDLPNKSEVVFTEDVVLSNVSTNYVAGVIPKQRDGFLADFQMTSINMI